jgi:predicted proteasome-type protease
LSEAVVRIAAGSDEIVSLPYTANVTNAAVDVGLVKWPSTAEPSTYLATSVADGEASFMVGTTISLEPRSLYRIWARVNDTPEVPVEPVGWLLTH